MPLKALNGAQLEGSGAGGEESRETGQGEGNCWSIRPCRSLRLKVSTGKMCCEHLLSRTMTYIGVFLPHGIEAEHISMFGMIKRDVARKKWTEVDD